MCADRAKYLGIPSLPKSHEEGEKAMQEEQSHSPPLH